MPHPPLSHPLVAVRPAPPPPAFACSWTSEGSASAWVTLAGELDIAAAPQLDETLRAALRAARRVTLDLRHAAFIDLSGIHVIVEASMRATRLGGRLVLLRGPPLIDRVFVLTGQTGNLEIRDVHPGDPDPLVPRAVTREAAA